MAGDPEYTSQDIDTLLIQSVDRADVGYVVVDRAGRVLIWNRWMERASGRARAEVLGVPLQSVFPEIVGNRLEDAIGNALERGMAGLLSAKLHRTPPLTLSRVDDAATVLTNPVIIVRPLDGAAPDRRGCLIQIIDETSSATREKTLRAQAITLKAQQEQLRTLFEAINDSLLLLDPNGLIVAINDTACLRLRSTKTALLGARVLDFLPKANADAYSRCLEALTRTGTPQRFEDVLGDDTHLVSMFPVSDHEGRLQRVAVLASDISERKAIEQRVFHLAHHDTLTGLPNRAYLLDRLEHAIDVSRRIDRRLALAFLDLDHFKMVNDTLGHDSGDALLREVAARLKSIVRISDTVARMGGDEFVILLEPAGTDENIANLMQKIIATLDMEWGAALEAIRITTSVGVAVFPDNGGDARGLMKAADTAMYAAKADGRNTFRFFSDEMTARTLQRLQLERELREAVDHGELELHYQPKMCFGSRKPCGVEALVRWRHPERGLVPPADFVPLAEETGFIIKIGAWVFEETCRQIAKWIGDGQTPLTIAVNVSPKQLFSKSFVGMVKECIDKYAIPPRQIQVEITESAVMSDPDRASVILSQLRGLGLSIAIDDFGTGYSSLTHLSKLPIDVIKIDRSFVAGVAGKSENMEIINAIVSLGRSLRMIVVAEGIETHSDVDVLTTAACHLGQGYLFAKPMRAPDLDQWLGAQESKQACEMCAVGDRIRPGCR